MKTSGIGYLLVGVDRFRRLRNWGSVAGLVFFASLTVNAANVTISVAGTATGAPNTFSGSALVTISSAFTNRSIFYSLDGSAPTTGGPLTYNGPFTVNTDATIRARAVNLNDFSTADAGPIIITIIPTYSLNVSTPGGGTVTKSPSAGSYLSNSVVTISATAAVGWTFLYWQGDVNGVVPSKAITMNRNMTVQAIFGTTLNIDTVGSGLVQLSPPNGPYAFGTTVQIMPKPMQGHYFNIWGGAASGSMFPLQFTVNQPNPTVSALFTELGSGQVNLYLDIVGNGSVTQSPLKNVYSAGETVTLTAVTPAISTFDGWTGNFSGTSNPLGAFLGSWKTVTANFSPKPQGTVIGWGENKWYAHSPPANLGSVKAILAINSQSIAIRSDDTVSAWGDGRQGLINVPDGLSNVVDVAIGSLSAAVRADGTVVVWGSVTNEVLQPPSGLSGVKAIASGGSYFLALKQDGTVVSWGSSVSAAIVPMGLSAVKAVVAGSKIAAAVKQDGSLVAWGDNVFGQLDSPEGLSGVTSIAIGNAHVVALKEEGTVVAWGSNTEGQIDIPLGLSGVKGIAAGGSHSAALKHDGTVVIWGNPDALTAYPLGLGGVVAIAAGTSFNLAIVDPANLPSMPTILTQPFASTTGIGQTAVFGVTVSGSEPFHYQWAYNDIALPVETNSTLKIANAQANQAGYYSVTITNQIGVASSLGATLTVNAPQPGTVIAWGNNDLGQTNVPANLTDAIDIAAGQYHTLALRQDGTVTAWGWATDRDGQTTVPAGLTGVQAIAAGSTHSIALKTDGSLLTWGSNVDGQKNVPADMSNVVAIAAGYGHSVALKSDGTVRMWGRNDLNQIVVPTGLSGVKAIAAGAVHTLALRQDGTVVAWGGDLDGQSTVPFGLNGVTAIAAGAFHNVALKSDGTVVAWGKNTEGQTNVPVGLTGVKAIAAGLAHTLALKQDRTIVGWGNNTFGQTIIPPGLTNVLAIAAGDASVVLYDPPATQPAAPSITQQPVGFGVTPGSSTVLSVTASGIGLSYQWRLNGTNIAGANASSLTLTNGSALLAGRYDVVVSNAVGSVASQPAILRFFGDLKMYPGMFIAGQTNDQYRIEYADAIGTTTNWMTATNIIHPGGIYFYVDPNGAGLSQRFYRAILLP